ncbi:PQQ-binding-like beta-propeller repeat protein [Streptomyces sp. NPDC002688]|uniref:outer membrane protein assembly factor BamB family protein n=1 Tax=Streptomyces sp. NPDC002688 TaxID=3154423 RepID=UPI00332514E1
MPSSLRLRSAVTFLLAAVTLPVLAACGTDSGPPRAVAAPTTSVAEQGPFGPRTLASQPRDLSSKPIAVGADVVLTLPDDRKALVAYDPATGAQRWKSPARAWYAEQAWPAGGDFIVSWTNLIPDGSDRSVVGNFVARLNGRTGKPVWATRITELISRAGDITFRPMAGAVLVHGASRYGWVAALDLESGKIRWTRDGYLRTADDFGSGDFGGTHALLYEPLDSYTDAGRLMRLDPRRGTVQWTVALGKAYGTTVYSIRRHVVVSRRGRDGDGTVLFLDGATGKRVAQAPGEVLAEDNNIVVVASERGVAAYDQTGDKLWELAGTVIADRQRGFSDGRTVYLLTDGEDEGAPSLVALDARSGKKLAYLARQVQAEFLGTVNGFLVAKNPYGGDGLIFPGRKSRV